MSFSTIFSNSPTINIIILVAIIVAAVLVVVGVLLYARHRRCCCFESSASRRRSFRANSAHQYHAVGGDGFGGGPGQTAVNVNTASYGPAASSKKVNTAGSKSKGGGMQAGAADLEDYLTNLVGTMDDRFQKRQEGGGDRYRQVTGKDLCAESDHHNHHPQQQQQHLDAPPTPGVGAPDQPAGGGSHNSTTAAEGRAAFTPHGDQQPTEQQQTEAAEKHIVLWLTAVERATAHLTLADLEPAVFDIGADRVESFQSGTSFGGISQASRYSGASNSTLLAPATPGYAGSQASSAVTPRVSEVDGDYA